MVPRILAIVAAIAISTVMVPVGVASASEHATVKQGSHGAAVKTLQHRLAELDYADVGAADGYFGANTYHAVVAFQKVNHLARDGIVGPNTWSALRDPATPKLRHPYSKRSVEVDLSRQVLFLGKGGKVTKILDASTGKASTPTPRGRYSVGREIDGWRKSDLGKLWRPKYFYGGYAIHGSPSVPSYPASHGCVRVTITTMNMLWPKIDIGTPVTVHK